MTAGGGSFQLVRPDIAEETRTHHCLLTCGGRTQRASLGLITQSPATSRFVRKGGQAHFSEPERERPDSGAGEAAWRHRPVRQTLCHVRCFAARLNPLFAEATIEGMFGGSSSGAPNE